MRLPSVVRTKPFGNRLRHPATVRQILCIVIVLALIFSIVLTPRGSPHRSIRPIHLDRVLSAFSKQHFGSVLRVQYSETRFNGFGSQFLRILDAAAVAQISNARFDIIEGRYWNYGCGPYQGWSCYFERNRVPAIPCTELAQRPKTPVTCILISSVASMRGAAALHSHLSKGQVTNSRQLGQQLWTPNAVTQQAVAQLIQQTGLDKLQGEYIGLHVRRGDKRIEAADVPIQHYAQAVECIGGNLPVFVATDDGKALTELRTRLAGRLVLALPDTKMREGHFQIHVNTRYLKKNRAAVSALLADVTALKDAKWFIGTFSSNFARMVHVLRRAPANMSISLDNQWAPGVAWRTFGMPYCASADANSDFCKCKGENQN